MKLADIYMQFQSSIEMIERELERSVQSRQRILREASTQLLKAGGKRIRPVFVLLSAKFGTFTLDDLKHIAIPLELIHMASLVHDDVIDDADLRRGEKTIKSRWDNRVAMYTGDYIFAKAVETSTYFNNPEIHHILSNAMVEMCIGEVEQIRDQYNWDQNFRIYLRRIKRKTALLISVSCELGALAANVDRWIQRRLAKFGYNVGMSFQIIDDILDFIGTREQLGKPAGGDLRQGNVTLPALYAMYKDPKIKQLIKETFSDRDPLAKKNIEPILEEIKRCGGIDYAKKVSELYLKKAFEALEPLPDTEAKTYLLEIASYIGKREY